MTAYSRPLLVSRAFTLAAGGAVMAALSFIVGHAIGSLLVVGIACVVMVGIFAAVLVSMAGPIDAGYDGCVGTGARYE